MSDFLEHLRTHALHTRGPFTLRSGAVSDWYLDARQTTFDGAGAILVARAVLSVLDETAKRYGLGDRVVGPVSGDDRVAIIEDTTTTGGALVEAIDVISDAGIPIVQAIALMDRSGGAVSDLLAERGIPYRALATPADLGVEP